MVESRTVIWIDKVEQGTNFPIVRIAQAGMRAAVSLYGANILSWVPEGRRDVFFMSKRAVFKEGKALRGGVPICWPWFGKHPEDAALPHHGVARIRRWELTDSEETEDGRAWLRFALQLNSPELRAIYSLEFSGETLRAVLTTESRNSDPLPFSAALHAYFAVSSNERVAITGLETTPFTECAQAIVPHRETPLVPAAPIDRIYCPVDADGIIGIHDPEWKRLIEIRRSGSGSCVVWNPGRTAAADMADLGADQAECFVAVEPAVVPAEGRVVKCNDVHRLSMCIRVLPVP